MRTLPLMHARDTRGARARRSSLPTATLLFTGMSTATGSGTTRAPSGPSAATGSCTTRAPAAPPKRTTSARPAGRPAARDYSFLRKTNADATEPFSSWIDRTAPKRFSRTEAELMMRFEMDLDARREADYVNELKKDPRFHPRMLEEPGSRYKTHGPDVGGGPIVNSHSRRKTALEPRRPHSWAPLGW